MSGIAVMKGEEYITDYQFRSIIKMVLAIARKTGNLADVINELETLLPKDERENNNVEPEQS